MITMKYNILAIFFFTLAFYSCSKDPASGTGETTEANGCIERKIVPVNGHTVTATDIAVINKLFLTNGIDNRKYRYYQYLHDVVQTYFPPFQPFDDKIVRVQEYTNGLPILTGQLVFDFKNDIFNFKNGYPT